MHKAPIDGVPNQSHNQVNIERHQPTVNRQSIRVNEISITFSQYNIIWSSYIILMRIVTSDGICYMTTVDQVDEMFHANTLLYYILFTLLSCLFTVRLLVVSYPRQGVSL